MQPAGKFESANFNLFEAIEQAPDAIIVAGRELTCVCSTPAINAGSCDR
jgi:hypothetical protein